MTTKHTKEPWSTHPSDDGWMLIMQGGPAGRLIANVNAESCPDINSAPAFVQMPSQANAARIVACVNALAGVSDPSAFVEAYKGIQTALERVVKGHTLGGLSDAKASKQAALAALQKAREAMR